MARIRKLWLNDIKGCQRSLSRIASSVIAGHLSDQKAATLCRILNVKLGYFRLEKELDIEKKIKEIEEYLEKNFPEQKRAGKRKAASSRN